MSESTHSRQRRDERIADEAQDTDSRLMCQAHGCPNRWSVDAGDGRLCSAHTWSGRALWPQITQEQIDAETDRAFKASAAIGREPDMPRRDPERMAKALRLLAVQKDTLAWAKRLQWCEERRGGRLPDGRQMTAFQREAWRQALRYRGEGPGEVATAHAADEVAA